MSELLLFVADYIKTAQRILRKIIVSNIKDYRVDFEEGVDRVADLFINLGSCQNIFLVGNGGSAGIASIVANRLWKFCGIKGHAFNDSVIMSCASNDYGWKKVFSKPLERYGRPGDILIAISSSGQSKNILNAVHGPKQS